MIRFFFGWKKLKFAGMFLLGEIDLLKNKSESCLLMMFSFIGMLIGVSVYYFNGYLFRA